MVLSEVYDKTGKKFSTGDMFYKKDRRENRIVTRILEGHFKKHKQMATTIVCNICGFNSKMKFIP
jgi:hypothetical protein